MSNYQRIIEENLSKAYQRDPGALQREIPAQRDNGLFCFKAFSQDCVVSQTGIRLDGRSEAGPKGVVISLYCRHTSPDPIQTEPFESFKAFPDSMPYQGAFVNNTERILVPLVPQVEKKREKLNSKPPLEHAPMYL
jgi:hypothetical protein